jgi:hypothetical protein
MAFYINIYFYLKLYFFSYVQIRKSPVGLGGVVRMVLIVVKKVVIDVVGFSVDMSAGKI